jgi:hypothetical protein
MSSNSSCYASNTYTSYSNWLSNRLNFTINSNRSNNNSSLSNYSNTTSSTTTPLANETNSLIKRKSIDFRRPSTSMFFTSKANASYSTNLNSTSSIDFKRETANKLRAKAKANIGILIGKKIQIFKIDQVALLSLPFQLSMPSLNFHLTIK